MTDHRQRLEAGLALHQTGRMGEAEEIYQEVLDADPANADAMHFLGLIKHQKGDLAKAVELISAALAIDNDRPTFHFNLAAALIPLGRKKEALKAYSRAAELKPDWAEAHFSGATLLAQFGRQEEAVSGFRRAIELQSDYAEAFNGLALALASQDQLDQAEEACRKAVDLNPNLVEAWTNLGNILQDRGELPAAEEAQRRALSLDPDYAIAHYNLGKVLAAGWRTSEAMDCYQAAIDRDQTFQDAWHSLLMNGLYLPDESEKTIYDRHRAWAASLGPIPTSGEFDPDRNPDKRLRIGYLSPDFRTHSCAYFLRPLFAAHDRSKVEIFAYSNLRRSDEITQRFEQVADHWRDIVDMNDQEAAVLIQEDRIDILVELAGHSANNRLALCALKPAPVQVSWLGYPATTGLDAIDYRFTDAITDPPGIGDDLHTETLWRLADGFHCYGAPEKAPEVGPSPYEKAGGITFGSFNNGAKVTPEAIRAWAQILQAIKQSKLILKNKLFDHPLSRQRICDQFATFGVGEERLDLRSWISREDNPLALYNEIDIALDTFPYNGTTTTFEALWMGTPVVTLRGNRHAGRVGAGILSHLGCPDWIAESIDDYAQIAKKLAENREKLSDIRHGLRSSLATSSLGQGSEFAQKIEAAYQEMWRQYLLESKLSTR